MDRITLVETFGDRCSLWRFRCPVETIAEGLAVDGSRYSPEFEVGGISWRLHFQHRTAPQTNDTYLAIHLQCCSAPGGYAHFRVTVCNRDPAMNKSKTFHCHFRKLGSAWGLHHFIPLDVLLAADGGFVEDAAPRRSAGSIRYVVFDVMVQVLEPGADGSYALGSLPQPTHSAPSIMAASAASRPRYDNAAAQPRSSSSRSMPPNSAPAAAPAAMTPAPAVPSPAAAVDPLSQAHVKAMLVYPFEHLESLCDMWFEVQGVRIRSHRCVVAARMAPLIPKESLPLQQGATVSLQVPMEVFSAFLAFVYTEEYPEAGVLSAEALIDLYLLAAPCEFYALCGVCLKLARPLLNATNILPIVLSRNNPADETLTAMYLRVLLDHYDAIITEKMFEEIPGHLFRRLSLILRDKERLPSIVIPPSKHTLGKQLAELIESGAYADYELQVPGGVVLKVHRYIMASRSVVFSQALHPRATSGDGITAPALPTLQLPEFQFSQRAWVKGLQHIYRRHVELPKDLSAEDIVFLFKLSAALVMDGQLKREADGSVSPANALRVLVYAVKHNVPELCERSLRIVGPQFHVMVAQDSAIWELIAELPQPSVVALFRMVTGAAASQAES